MGERAPYLELSAAGVAGVHTVICLWFTMESWARDIFFPIYLLCLFGRAGSQLWHTGSLVVAWELSGAACGIGSLSRIKPGLPEFGARSLSPQTARQVPGASGLLSPRLSVSICEMGLRVPTSQGIDVWHLIGAGRILPVFITCLGMWLHHGPGSVKREPDIFSCGCHLFREHQGRDWPENEWHVIFWAKLHKQKLAFPKLPSGLLKEESSHVNLVGGS